MADVAVVGGGANGLVCAAYLARAGRAVTLLEAGERPGGTLAVDAISGDESGPRAPAVFAGLEALSPEVVAELRLERHGLRLGPPGPVLAYAGDGDVSPLFLPPVSSNVSTATARAIADAAGAADGEAFERFDRFSSRLAGAMAPVLARPLPALEPDGMAGWLALARPAWRLRRLGRDDLAEAMRLLPMPIADVLDERFASDALKVAIALDAVRGSWLGTRSPGGALNLLLHRAGHARGALPHPRFAAGGPAALIDALAAAARAAGVEVRTGARAARIAIRDGRAAGIVLEDGSEVAAGAVVSTADPRTTMLDLLDPAVLDPEVRLALRHVRARGTVGIVRFALDGLPPFAGVDGSDAPERLAGRIVIARHPGAPGTGSPGLDAIERAFDDTKYGRLPRHPLLDVTIPTLADPDAGNGTHAVHVWAQYPPYALREGSWSEQREPFGDLVQAQLEAVAPGFGDRVLARDVATPADLEARYGLAGGCLYQVEPALDQVLYMRPLPGWGRHGTAIPGLYLGGAGSHGAPGPSGLPGRNAARVVLEASRGGVD